MTEKKIEITAEQATEYMLAAESAWEMLNSIREYDAHPTYEQITLILQSLEKISNGIWEASKKGE